MSKSRLIVLAFCLLGGSSLVHAQSISWGANLSYGLGESDGTELAVGDLVRIGTFNLTELQIQQHQSDLSFLNNAFLQYDTAAIGDGEVPPIPAHWIKLSTGPTDSLGLSTKPIYFWAFNASTLGGATEHGIFTSTATVTTDTTWTFPSDNDIPNTRNIDLEQVDKILVGSFGQGTSSASGADLFNLAPVPEPATTGTVFALMCASSVVVLRRFRRK